MNCPRENRVLGSLTADTRPAGRQVADKPVEDNQAAGIRVAVGSRVVDSPVEQMVGPAPDSRKRSNRKPDSLGRRKADRRRERRDTVEQG